MAIIIIVQFGISEAVPMKVPFSLLFQVLGCFVCIYVTSMFVDTSKTAEVHL